MPAWQGTDGEAESGIGGEKVRGSFPSSARQIAEEDWLGKLTLVRYIILGTQVHSTYKYLDRSRRGKGDAFRREYDKRNKEKNPPKKDMGQLCRGLAHA